MMGGWAGFVPKTKGRAFNGVLADAIAVPRTSLPIAASHFAVAKARKTGGRIMDGRIGLSPTIRR
jgi:hypothetical protein